jgi:spore coat protein CotH
MSKRKRHYTDWIEVDKYIRYLKGKVKTLNKKIKRDK